MVVGGGVCWQQFASYFGNDAHLVGQIQGTPRLFQLRLGRSHDGLWLLTFARTHTAWFSAVDTDRSGQLDQAEIGRALQQAGVRSPQRRQNKTKKKRADVTFYYILFYLKNNFIVQLNFSPATLRRLLTTFDLDRSGQIGVNEFVCLYQFVLSLRNSFAAQDRDRSGKLDNCTPPPPPLSPRSLLADTHTRPARARTHRE
jgi:hypothetical protein